MRRLFFVCCCLLVVSPLQAKLVSKDVHYEQAGVKLTGYLVYDDAIKGKRPGVLVIHEWWGHTRFARDRADDLARDGYVAFALDMYGDGKIADHPQDAKKFSSQVWQHLDVAQARFEAAEKQLKASPLTDASKIAVVGFCFGGGIALEMARRGADVDAVVVLHGSLGTQHPAQVGHFKPRVLVLNGADDPFVKPESIQAFKQEMKQAKVDMTFVNYPGAKHAFTNPEATANGKKFGIPIEYNAEAARQAWARLEGFLKDVFR